MHWKGILFNKQEDFLTSSLKDMLDCSKKLQVNLYLCSTSKKLASPGHSVDTIKVMKVSSSWRTIKLPLHWIKCMWASTVQKSLWESQSWVETLNVTQSWRPFPKKRSWVLSTSFSLQISSLLWTSYSFFRL